MCAQFSYKMSLTCTRYSNYIFSILCFPIFVWSVVLIQELYFLVLTIHHCHFYATLYWCLLCKTPQQYFSNKFFLLYSYGECTLSSLTLFPVLKKQPFLLTGPRRGKIPNQIRHLESAVSRLIRSHFKSISLLRSNFKFCSSCVLLRLPRVLVQGSAIPDRVLISRSFFSL